MRAVAAAIDAVIGALGRAVGWLTLALVLLVFGLVLTRYAFAQGSIAAQDAVQWLHSLVFLLGAACALRHGQHVRVDLFYQRFSPRGRAWVDLLGTLLLLLPFCAFMLWISLDYVAASWSMREGAREPGGLPGVYLLKSVIPLAAALLVLQGVALALRALLALRAERS
jgi:TRAP-type mannitol/chloroaromatic compound transport system permease small subunit